MTKWQYLLSKKFCNINFGLTLSVNLSLVINKILIIGPFFTRVLLSKIICYMHFFVAPTGAQRVKILICVCLCTVFIPTFKELFKGTLHTMKNLSIVCLLFLGQGKSAPESE